MVCLLNCTCINRKKITSAKMEHKTENSKPRLLLVDSNELIRDIFKMLFERLGYYAVTVRTAREGGGGPRSLDSLKV